MSLIFIPGQELLPVHIHGLGNIEGVAGIPGSSATTSSSFINLSPAVSFTKFDSASRLRVDLHASCFVTGSVPDVVEFGISINSVDYPMVKGTFSSASVHKMFSCIRLISGIAAGTYTTLARFRRASGSGTVTTDLNSYCSFTVIEVQE